MTDPQRHPADQSSYSELAVDVEAYSRLQGWRQAEVRRDLSEMLDRAATAAHLDRAAWSIQDRGDGELALIPSTVPKANLVADLIRELVTALTNYNATHNERGRIRVRVALHHGEARIDRGGFPGDAPVVVCRLVESEQAREALRARPDAHLALILSDRMFQDTVAAGERGLDRRGFTRVEIEEPKFEGVAWVAVPGFAPPGPPTSVGATASPSAAPHQRGGMQIVRDHARVINDAKGAVAMGDGSLAAEHLETDHVELGGTRTDRRSPDDRARPASRQ